ncbi:MAG: alpha/beta hydrolase [Anaerolineales bacterium]|nr:alpha/beta hydrolase [Anaerolineales bacterium]
MLNDTPVNEKQALVKKAYKVFFTPGKYEVKPTEAEILKNGNNLTVQHDVPATGAALELAVTAWGNPAHPKALLLHGWGGARAQLTGFVEPLLQAGYFVVAYDQPAHGASAGRQTNILEIGPTLTTITRRFGGFDAMLAHSFGTLIASYALVKLNCLPPAKLVYFGAFNRLMDALPRFQTLAKLPDDLTDGIRDLLFENFSAELLNSIVNAELVKELQIPALMFHDHADEVTPVEDSRAIAKTWQGVQYVETKGLGHRGALQSKETQEQVVRFLKG